MTHLRRLMRAPGTYFVTANTWQRRALFRKEPPARLFLECLLRYPDQARYLLHEFVLMPDHFHLLLTPGPDTTLERALQLIKGGSSYVIRHTLKYVFPVWQTGFDDHRVRGPSDYSRHRFYRLENPVQAGLAAHSAEYPYGSASDLLRNAMDPWLQPETSAAKAAPGAAGNASRAKARARQEESP